MKFFNLNGTVLNIDQILYFTFRDVHVDQRIALYGESKPGTTVKYAVPAKIMVTFINESSIFIPANKDDFERFICALYPGVK